MPEADCKCLNPGCFSVPLAFIERDFNFDFRKICQVKLMTSLMLCLIHMDNRTRIQIVSLYSCHSAVEILQWIEVQFFGAIVYPRQNLFFLNLIKTLMKKIGIIILVKQVFINEVTKGIT